MKNQYRLIIIILLFSLSSCYEEKKIQGYLAFKGVNICDPKIGFTQSDILNLETALNSENDLSNSNSRNLKKIISIVKENKLFNVPLIRVVKEDRIHLVFLKCMDYALLNKYDYTNLAKSKKQVFVILEGEFVEDNIFICSKINEIKETKGNTKFLK